MPPPFLPQRAAARWFAGKLANSDWPATARDALEAGFDGRALRRLAALEKANHWDVVNFIGPALSEMGAPHMSIEDALLWSAKDICREIAGGSRDPFDGAAEISQDIIRTLVFPKELMPIFEEIEMFDTGFLAGGEAESRERIFSHASKLLGQESAPNQETSVKSEFQFFEHSGLRLHAIVAGPKDGPVVVLLHGFPEFWYGWHRQIEPLAAAGFRVIVPDQRGYNLSSKPAGVAAYALTELVSDVIAVGDQLGQEKIFLAGHDWGAAVAWSAALLCPQRIAKLVVVNVPHPSVMRRFMMKRVRQMLRSWYIFFFQLPYLPEAFFTAFHFRVGERSLLRSSRPGTFSSDDLAQYRSAWSQPGALTGMINWYRALFRFRTKFPDRTVRIPTRILWGERDAFLLPEMAQESLRYCSEAELFTFANATHWLQHEEPARVSEFLIDFFRS